MSVEIVKKDVGYLLEGPHWDSSSETLLYVNILGKMVYRYDSATNKTDEVKLGWSRFTHLHWPIHDDSESQIRVLEEQQNTEIRTLDVEKGRTFVSSNGGKPSVNYIDFPSLPHTSDEQVGAIVPTRSGRTLVAAGHTIGFLDWETGKIEVLVEVEKDKPEIRFNDAKCDAAGRLWAGTMAFETLVEGTTENPLPDGRASLYCFHPDRTIKQHLQNVKLSNGLAWTADKKTMYYIDSFEHGVDAFDYDITNGTLRNRRRVITIPESDGVPDGMCIDNEGMLWVAHLFGAAVRRYNPMTGEKLRTVQLPTNNITSCCWGGKNFDELYVTSAKILLSDEQLKAQDAAGSLFRVTGLGVRGVKAEVFNDE